MISDSNYFDHDADQGIIGKGNTLEASFVDAAIAMFGLMADLSSVHPVKKYKIEFVEADEELAFVTWLNLLLAKAYEENLIFSKFTLKKNKEHWNGEALGENWREGIEPGIEVKGATLTMLSVRKINNHWEAKCVVDV